MDHAIGPHRRQRRERVRELLEQAEGFSIPSETLRAWRGHVVYVVFHGEQPVYVGMSTTGLGRVCQGSHHAGHLMANAHVQVWCVASKDAARELESLLIESLQPYGNRTRIGRAAVARVLGLVHPLPAERPRLT